MMECIFVEEVVSFKGDTIFLYITNGEGQHRKRVLAHKAPKKGHYVRLKMPDMAELKDAENHLNSMTEYTKASLVSMARSEIAHAKLRIAEYIMRESRHLTA